MNYYKSSNFIKSVYDEIDSLSTKEFYERKDRNTKYLLEEKLPVAVFLKHLLRPGLNIKCRHCMGNQNYDSEIKLSGFFVDHDVFLPHYYLEVTTAIAENDYLIRESLSKIGYASNDLKRKPKSKEIIQNSKAVDYNFPETEASRLITKCLSEKEEMHYNANTVLLISVRPERPFGIHQYISLLKNIEYHTNVFCNVFIIDPYENIVLELNKS